MEEKNNCAKIIEENSKIIFSQYNYHKREENKDNEKFNKLEKFINIVKEQLPKMKPLQIKQNIENTKNSCVLIEDSKNIFYNNIFFEITK